MARLTAKFNRPTRESAEAAVRALANPLKPPPPPPSPKQEEVFRALPGSQTLFMLCKTYEALYEGTRGPGKTITLLMDFAQHVGLGFGAAWKGVLFRREYKELGDVVTKSKKFFPLIWGSRARFLESGASYKWVWDTGEELLFRVGVSIDDYWSYHGHEYPWLGYDELCTWPTLDFYHAMKTVCRSVHPGVPRKIRATTNPYGPGHAQVKAYFIDPAPSGVVIRDEGGRERVRITGKIWENVHLIKNDPDYIRTLLAEPDPNRRRAWLDGDWDIVAGGIFDGVWREALHVMQPFKIPPGWEITRAFDWGSARPFSVGWWARSNGTDAVLDDGTRKSYPRDTIFRIGEWYGWNGKPNEGCGMVASEIARGILAREEEMGLRGRVRPGPADTGIFEVANGVCIADDMGRLGVTWLRANKGPGSRKNGWELMRDRLKAAHATPMERGGMFIFNTCRHFLRTVPILPRDDRDPEDVDTDAEDHIGDESRYLALHFAGDPLVSVVSIPNLGFTSPHDHPGLTIAPERPAFAHPGQVMTFGV